MMVLMRRSRQRWHDEAHASGTSLHGMSRFRSVVYFIGYFLFFRKVAIRRWCIPTIMR